MKKMSFMMRHLHRMGLVLFAFDPEDAETKAAVKKLIDDATKALKDELKSKNPDLKAQIEEAIAEQTAALAKKNKELQAELREAKRGKDVDPAELEKLQKQVDDLDNQLSTTRKELKTAQTEAAKFQKAHTSEAAFTEKLLIDQGLTEALMKAGVTNATRLKASIAMLRSGVKVVAEGDTRKAMFGDKELSAYVPEWAGTDEGKEFVTAAANSGGGGGGNGKGKVDLNAEQLKSLPPVERMNRAREALAAAGK